MINILFVVNSLKPRGAEQQLFSFIKSLPPSINICIFSFSNNKNEFPEFFQNDKDIKFYLNPYQGTYNIRRFWPLIHCLKKEKIDIVITVGLGAALLLGRTTAFIFRKKIIYSLLNTIENFNNLPRLRGSYFDMLNQGVNRLLPLFSKSSIYRFLPNSDQLSKTIKDETHRYEIKTFYNGLPLREFKKLNAQANTHAITALLKIIEGHPTIVQVGALDANKNVLFTIKCISEIKKKVSNVRLLIVGDGPLNTDLKYYINNSGLEKVVILGGQHTRANCIRLMQKANVIVLTSHSESFPNVLMEGHLMGLPAVTFDVGAAKEIVENLITGFVVPQGDRSLFVKCITRLLSDAKAAEEMGRQGRQRVCSIFSMDKKIDQFLEMIEADLHVLSST